MQYRPLGRTGLSVSSICLGTMTWGQQNTEAEGHAQMDYALERGINFFDTAELYSIPPKAETQGSTERIIGSWFKARKNRDKVILASKVCGRTGFAWFRDNGATTRVTPAQIREAVDKSLARLGTDYIDLYQIHSPDRKVPWGSNPTRFDPQDYQVEAGEADFALTLETLGECVKAGKIRHVGLSNESAWGTMRYLAESEAKALPRIVSIQNAYNLINRTYETALAEITLREQVGLLAYSPLAQGFLTGKYLDGARPEGARETLFQRGTRYQKPGAEEAIRDYVDLAQQYGLDPAVMANAFVVSRPFVTANIIGATSMAQLQLAIDAGSVTLSGELLDKIDLVHQLRGNPAP
ncbi:MAG: aldo/keto reductase [Proteobacteria bacterium]|nr:aldo/keto reductase [Pseudomonadota bacterium]